MDAEGWHRPRATVILAVLTVVAVVATTVAAWTSRTALQATRFMGLVEPVLASPEVADAIGRRVTDVTLQALDLEERLDVRLGEVQVALGTALADDPRPATTGPAHQSANSQPQNARVTSVTACRSAQRHTERQQRQRRHR